MKISVDSNIFTTQKYGGVSRYFAMLGRELTTNGHKFRVHGIMHRNRHLDESKCLLTSMRMLDDFPPHSRRVIHYLNDIRMEMDLMRSKPDLIHESYYQRRRIGNRKIPRVCTIHDMIHELLPQFIGNKDTTPTQRLASIQRADAIICVSENTRNDLLRMVRCDENKLHVVHHGYENHSLSAPLNQADLHAFNQLRNKPYILYVGARSGYKNFINLVAGFARSESSEELSIVLFGGGEISKEEMCIAEHYKLNSALIQISGTDALLGKLYSGAVALIYPSIYEGFGLPPLEAMSKDCPVLSSNTSSMPEIIGDAAIYFDPYDHLSIAKAIDSIYNSSTFKEKLIKLGRLRLNQFSWNSCAKKTLSVYETIL